MQLLPHLSVDHKKLVKQLSLLLVMVLILGSCKFRNIQKSADWRLKYEAGLAYFEKQDYYRSAYLFEDILPIVRGLPEGETVQFNLGYCQFYEKTYILAAHQFKRFYETYGRSERVQEAKYMHAYALFKSTPPFSNDQEGTVEAMASMQMFLNQYPTSTFSEKAAETITECQSKLERKSFANAKLYLRLKYYEAAVISLDNFQKKFPDSGFYEEAFSLRIKAQFLLAKNSIRSKQLDRYRTTLDSYKEFVDTYPSSNYFNNIESYYEESLSSIDKLKSNNS